MGEGECVMDHHNSTASYFKTGKELVVRVIIMLVVIATFSAVLVLVIDILESSSC